MQAAEIAAQATVDAAIEAEAALGAAMAVLQAARWAAI